MKLTNLQEMAKTVAFIQEHGYDSQEDLQAAFSESQMQTTEMRKALRSTEQKLKEVNEQIHYTGQYLANKSVYGQFLKSKNKKQFRQEHQSEITLYETACRILKERSEGGKLPSIKFLKAEKEKLTTLKDSQYEAYQNLRNYQNDIPKRQTQNASTDLSNIPFTDTSAIPTPFIFIKSDLRLVIDLQTCIKAQQNEAYAQKVKRSNLKQMAQTVAYIQEHGYDSLDDFHAALNQVSDQCFQKIFKRY